MSGSQPHRSLALCPPACLGGPICEVGTRPLLGSPTRTVQEHVGRGQPAAGSSRASAGPEPGGCVRVGAEQPGDPCAPPGSGPSAGGKPTQPCALCTAAVQAAAGLWAPGRSPQACRGPQQGPGEWGPLAGGGGSLRPGADSQGHGPESKTTTQHSLRTGWPPGGRQDRGQPHFRSTGGPGREHRAVHDVPSPCSTPEATRASRVDHTRQQE